jgi:hypothetical protein
MKLFFTNKQEFKDWVELNKNNFDLVYAAIDLNLFVTGSYRQGQKRNEHKLLLQDYQVYVRNSRRMVKNNEGELIIVNTLDLATLDKNSSNHTRLLTLLNIFESVARTNNVKLYIENVINEKLANVFIKLKYTLIDEENVCFLKG